MKVSNIGLISKKLEKLDEQFPVQDMLVQTRQLYQYTISKLNFKLFKIKKIKY